jgi:archaellum component FlaG (FlaF/FlaG flagellin family)
MTRKKPLLIIIGLIVIAVSLSVASSGALSALTGSQNLRTSGTLAQVQGSVNLGIYTDPQCTQNASFVNWGALQPGGSTTKTIYIKNLGDSEVALSLSTYDWAPQDAIPAITLIWNQDNTRLAPQETLQTTLTLSVAPDVSTTITTFSFNILITGTTA